MGSIIKSNKNLIKPCDCNHECNAKRFEQNFKNWTSGNNQIDKFIQSTQLSDHNYYYICQVLEWIPYDRFYDIKYITEGKLSKMYKANWIDGHIRYWSEYKQNWKREKSNMFVILKILNDLTSITSEFMNKV
jgi:hypothetical protein